MFVLFYSSHTRVLRAKELIFVYKYESMKAVKRGSLKVKQTRERVIMVSIEQLHSAAQIFEHADSDDGAQKFLKAKEIVGTDVALAMMIVYSRVEVYLSTKFSGLEHWSSVDNAIMRQLPNIYRYHDREIATFHMGEWYCFDNFSAFSVKWKDALWPTVEHAYQASKFEFEGIREEIRNASSAHETKQLANRMYGIYIRPDWNDIKLSVMEEIVRHKLEQHPYVKKKLMESGQMILVEDSHEDAFWGRGPDYDGQNHLGKIWMKLRDEKVKNQETKAV